MNEKKIDMIKIIIAIVFGIILVFLLTRDTEKNKYEKKRIEYLKTLA
jgi:preprotein translocase subunit YajC